MNKVLKGIIDESVRRGVMMSTIKAALKKCGEGKDAPTAQRHFYEGRLYGKLYTIVAIYTDNKVLTRGQLTAIFKKHRFETKSVDAMSLFDERGLIDALARPDIGVDSIEDECLNDAIEAGAEDVEIHDAKERQVTFYCNPNAIAGVKQNLSSAGHQIVHSERAYESKGLLVTLNEAEATDFDLFRSKLETIDGFDEIYANLAEETTEQ